jgi:hypothetical protein
LLTALRSKPESRGFDSQLCRWNLPFLPVAMSSTQHLKKWVPGILPGRQKRPVRRADNLSTCMCRLSWNLGA